MNLDFRKELIDKYHSKSQLARVITEEWMLRNMFCPRCGKEEIEHFANNKPVADFFCSQCAAQYELKSRNGKIGGKVSDGAYETMVERITSKENPDFFFMGYSLNGLCVRSLIMVPRHFFTPDIIEKRKPLSPVARRAGWVGCSILLDKIPEQGRISIIHEGRAENKDFIVAKVRKAQQLDVDDTVAKGWLLDVLNCMNSIKTSEFELKDIYCFEKALSEKHPDNNNIRPKIRQQLQLLRDKGFVEFLGKGKYKKYL
ncbi:MAG: hypothetical protein NC211_04940 [Alistipes senegalensis]|nr:hypothetical protein [Oxalobacter formigenes]MCM1281162.1 hypothetical protein [Alistipes senegalensis]